KPPAQRLCYRRLRLNRSRIELLVAREAALADGGGIGLRRGIDPAGPPEALKPPAASRYFTAGLIA
ncbi:MAG: hypothetical protein ACRCUI_09400, partial [Polymorphobacter sp.]